MAKILVIDDEYSVRIYLQYMLKAFGHTVILADGGSQGLSRFAEESPDLVITDMFMPGKDGVEVIRQVRKLAPEVPVIAITGNPFSNVLDFARHLGVAAVLEKPFSRDQLLHTLKSALASLRPVSVKPGN